MLKNLRNIEFSKKLLIFIEVPSSNVFTLELGESGKIIFRPSGTEPKIKLYYTAVGQSWEEANTLMERFKAAKPASSRRKRCAVQVFSALSLSLSASFWDWLFYSPL